MKKAFKIIGYVVGGLFVLVCILAIVADKHIAITSKQQISASRQEVFDQIRYQKNYTNWSPFKVQDPDQKTHVSGPDGEVGATFHWEGVKEESKGTQTVTATNGIDKCTINCIITVPFESKPTFDYQLNEKDGGVEVVQNFTVEMPFPANVFGLVFGVKDYLAKTNQQGLDLLKNYTESKLEKVSSVK